MILSSQIKNMPKNIKSNLPENEIQYLQNISKGIGEEFYNYFKKNFQQQNDQIKNNPQFEIEKSLKIYDLYI